MNEQLELFPDDIGLEVIKLKIAKLICCGASGCIGLVKRTVDDADRCWCDMPDCGKGISIYSTTDAIVALFENRK